MTISLEEHVARLRGLLAEVRSKFQMTDDLGGRIDAALNGSPAPNPAEVMLEEIAAATASLRNSDDDRHTLP